MARSRTTHFNILPMSNHETSDPVAQTLLRCPQVDKAIKALQEAGTKLSSQLPSYVQKPSSLEHQTIDLMDWLGALFDFQSDNVRNQREHVIFLLANHKLRSEEDDAHTGHGPPHAGYAYAGHEEEGVEGLKFLEHSIKFLHRKLLENYKKWCTFLGKEHKLQRRDDIVLNLAYPCLYLLIWGEAANLRFMPECLCFIFHNMADKLNAATETDRHTEHPYELNASSDTHQQTEHPYNKRNEATESNKPPKNQNTLFLEAVIKPIYNAVKAEARGSKNGKAPHSSWRNYDDMNEFFWSRHCFTQLQWPPYKDTSSDYLTNVPKKAPKTGAGVGTAAPVAVAYNTDDPESDIPGQASPQNSRRPEQQITLEREKTTRFQRLISLGQRTLQRQNTLEKERGQRKRKMIRSGKRMGFKVGFVEQRSFWNVFHSFHRLWIAQLLTLQVLITLAFSGNDAPWALVYNRDIQAKLLYIFVTWAGLRVVQALLTIIMQFTLISRNAKLRALHMVLKLLASIAWVTIFCIMRARIEEQRVRDKGWSTEANLLLLQFLGTVGCFLLPEIIVVLVFLMPWLGNITENSDKKFIQILAWWFHTRSYVGRGMHQNLLVTLKYTLFWLVILATKISFSYYLQIRPLVRPTQNLLSMKNVTFRWHEFFQNHNRFVVAVLWAPVILIYFMDTQIWFSIFSAVVGAMVGLFSHVGEVRNLKQFRLRFPFFASAITFNLLPEKPKRDKKFRYIKDMLERLKIRYGFDRHFTEMQSEPYRAWQFAYLWNHIIFCFREEDLVSNEEVEWLKIQSAWATEATDTKVALQWPLVFLSNEVASALHQATKKIKDDKNHKPLNRNEDDMPDDETLKLWAKISKSKYQKNAVQEAFYSLKHLLLNVIWKNKGSSYHLLEGTITEIEKRCQQQNFLRHFKANELQGVLSHFLKLIGTLLENSPQTEAQRETQRASIAKALLDLIDGLVRDLPKDRKEVSDLERNDDVRHHGSDLIEAVQVPDLDNDTRLHSHLLRLQYLLHTKENLESVPKNVEASRRLAFFSNSLFMTMPRSPTVNKMLAFSVLTPYFKEDVMYSTTQLYEPNEDGINIEFYLQQIFPDEWKNLEERVGDEPKDPERRKWASYRGQTLSRTVRGMMYYQRALEVLAHLEATPREKPAEFLNLELSQVAVLRKPELSPPDKAAALTKPQELPHKAAVLLKFSYVVACQAYEELLQEAMPKATEIKMLMQNYPSLRVSYVSKEVDESNKKHYYSILAKYDHNTKDMVTVYKIKLPGNFKLGEGKPENQNQAIIFTRGEALQTIDMNQDNYFEEALKVRNLLQEFNEPEDEMQKPRILGIRENVFMGSVSSLASFMSAQETSFVTLSQRVLANPLKIRMHYGHPDMFDRLWFLARGGVSKASKAINISEDIYAGFNCTLRGGDVTHNEYIQVGKGRDVGLNQITMFEAKISGGNGEQMLSRDVYRLGHRLDFFRMFSFYYTTVGFYFSSLLVVLAAYAFLWGRVYMGLSGIEEAIIKNTLSNAALTATLNQQLVVQIGLFSSLPMIVENSLEWGFTDAAWQFLIMQLQLCSVFYTFCLGTKAHYFGRTLLHGGAKYKPTGREFVVKRETFVTNYRYHSRSHFVKGAELIILLIIYEKYSSIAKNSTVYTLMTISYWFLALTWILTPFLFNPSGFDWLQTVYDYENFQKWLWRRRGVSTKAEESWEVWWNEEQDHLNYTGFWGRVIEVVVSVRFFLIQYGMVYRLNIAAQNKSILVYVVSWIYVVVAVVVYMVVARAAEKYGARRHAYYRGIQCFVVLFVVMVIVLLVELTDFKFEDLFVSALAFLPTGWGLLSMAAVGKPLLEETAVWGVVVEVARLYDLAIGLIVLAPVAVFSWFPGFQNMQTRILFNQAFSRGLQISRLLSGKKATYRGSY